MGAIGETGGKIECLDIGSFGTWKPVSAIFEQVVAHFSIIYHVIGDREISQPEDGVDINVSRGV